MCQVHQVSEPTGTAPDDLAKTSSRSMGCYSTNSKSTVLFEYRWVAVL